MMKYFLIILLVCCTSFSDANNREKEEIKPYTEVVYATYYAKKFEGRRTTSGERYRAKKYTAAHLNLPFGTRVTVTNLSNCKSVVVKVNDRGPYSRKYAIDLSESAAKKIGIYRKGHARVELSYVLGTAEE